MDPPWEGARRAQATDGKLEGPRKTVEYQDKVWAIPFTTNTQLLWYRKDSVKKPPEDFTWDEMIDQAAKDGKSIEVQAAQYEGYTVWINSLIAGAGGQIVDEDGNVKVDETAEPGRGDHQAPGHEAAPPGHVQQQGGPGADRLRVRALGLPGQLPVHLPERRGEQGRGVPEEDRLGALPAHREGQAEPPPLGGINIGVGAYTKNQDLAFEAARCLAQPENQVVASEQGGLPPTTEAAYDDPKVKKACPFADLLRESIEDGAPRPVNPAYSDISLAIQKTFHPPDSVEPDEIVDKLQDRMDKAAEGKIF